ncbi:MAG: helix-turn-helix domain-containing protein [Oscillospiraceae bacterium]|nr:helix-turn-helix domain-containing protein [Oscillospiraceae bacterium]
MEISQERLSEVIGVTVQAVSKWETEQSIPDVSIIPEIARFFDITIDELFFGKNKSDESNTNSIPCDGKLHILQAMNGKILKDDEWSCSKRIYLEIGPDDNNLTVEIAGSADIKGNIGGGIDAKGAVNCNNVSGNIIAEGGVNCGNVSGDIDANGGVVCDNVSGNIDVNGGIVCDKIAGSVDTTGNIQAGNISGNIDCRKDIHCECIKNSNSIKCEVIYVKGNVSAQKIEGKIVDEFDFE